MGLNMGTDSRSATVALRWLERRTDAVPLPIGRIACIASLHGVAIDDARGRSMTGTLPAARRAVAVYMLACGLPVSRIAAYLGRDHRSVTQLLERAGAEWERRRPAA